MVGAASLPGAFSPEVPNDRGTPRAAAPTNTASRSPRLLGCSAPVFLLGVHFFSSIAAGRSSASSPLSGSRPPPTLGVLPYTAGVS